METASKHKSKRVKTEPETPKPEAAKKKDKTKKALKDTRATPAKETPTKETPAKETNLAVKEEGSPSKKRSTKHKKKAAEDSGINKKAAEEGGINKKAAEESGNKKVETKKAAKDESGDFALNASNWLLKHNNVDLLMNLKDQYWCETILGTNTGTLNDLAGIFLRSHNVYADEKAHWGPPKWNYSSDVYDCFDYYIQNGCPNCGMQYSTDFPDDLVLKPVAVLTCKACGHRACPLHFDTESEAIVDRLEYSLQQSKEAKQADVPGAVYIRGSRRVHDFGQNGKEWWQSYFLPASYRLDASQASMAGSDLLGDSKGEKVKEVCEVCGHDEAFFATFQARSADEGLTIMYECTRCHSRKTFNN